MPDYIPETTMPTIMSCIPLNHGDEMTPFMRSHPVPVIWEQHDDVGAVAQFGRNNQVNGSLAGFAINIRPTARPRTPEHTHDCDLVGPSSTVILRSGSLIAIVDSMDIGGLAALVPVYENESSTPVRYSLVGAPYLQPTGEINQLTPQFVVLSSLTSGLAMAFAVLVAPAFPTVGAPAIPPVPPVASGADQIAQVGLLIPPWQESGIQDTTSSTLRFSLWDVGVPLGLKPFALQPVVLSAIPLDINDAPLVDGAADNQPAIFRVSASMAETVDNIGVPLSNPGFYPSPGNEEVETRALRYSLTRVSARMPEAVRAKISLGLLWTPRGPR